MDKNDHHSAPESSNAHQGKEASPSSTVSVPTENKATALVKQEKLMLPTVQLLPSLVELSVAPVARSTGKSKAELWNDTASKDLLEELMRRKDLERRLGQVERQSKEQLETQVALHSKRLRYLWTGLMCFSVILFCLAMFFGSGFLDSQKTYRDLSEQLAQQPQTFLPSLQDIQLSQDAKNAFIIARKSAIWQDARLSSILAILSGICPALLLFKLKHWWAGYSRPKGMVAAFVAAICGVGAIYLPFAVWVDFRNTALTAGASLVALIVHILHVQSGLLEKKAFASPASDANENANREKSKQNATPDARTQRLLEKLNLKPK